MKIDFLDIIRSPSCGGKFKLEVCIEDFEIEEGELICKSCSNKYKIHAGIPILLDKMDNMDLKRKEIEGWKKRREMKKILQLYWLLFKGGILNIHAIKR